MRKPDNEECLGCGWLLADGGGSYESGPGWGKLPDAGSALICTVCACSGRMALGNDNDGPSPRDLSYATNLILHAIRSTPDPRWRPMRTAPKDGTVVEVLNSAGIAEILSGEQATNPAYEYVHTAWRPSHPEWNEEGEG